MASSSPRDPLRVHGAQTTVRLLDAPARPRAADVTPVTHPAAGPGGADQGDRRHRHDLEAGQTNDEGEDRDRDRSPRRRRSPRRARTPCRPHGSRRHIRRRQPRPRRPHRGAVLVDRSALGAAALDAGPVRAADRQPLDAPARRRPSPRPRRRPRPCGAGAHGPGVHRPARRRRTARGGGPAPVPRRRRRIAAPDPAEAARRRARPRCPGHGRRRPGAVAAHAGRAALLRLR